MSYRVVVLLVDYCIYDNNNNLDYGYCPHSNCRHTDMCEDSVSRQKPQDMVDNASAIARLGNRVLMRCKQECDNSEDPHYVARLQQASRQLETAIAPMIQNAKQVAQRIHDPDTAARWRTANNSVSKEYLLNN